MKSKNSKFFGPENPKGFLKTRKNVFFHDHQVTREERENLMGHKAVVLWFTGLSGSGKSTIATELQKKLLKQKHVVYILDGDNVRHGLNTDLGFSPEDRKENIRRVGEVAKLFVDAGLIVIVSLVSPYKEYRQDVRKNLGNDYIEVYVKCGLAECEKRDTKGLYKKVRAGEIKDFTGVDAPYEEPENPEVVIDTEKNTVEKSVDIVYGYLKKKKII